jgi:hypothetical protein
MHTTRHTHGTRHDTHVGVSIITTIKIVIVRRLYSLGRRYLGLGTVGVAVAAATAVVAPHKLFDDEEGQQTGQHAQPDHHGQVLPLLVPVVRVRMGVRVRMAAFARARRVERVRDEVQEHVRQQTAHGEAQQHYHHHAVSNYIAHAHAHAHAPQWGEYL